MVSDVDLTFRRPPVRDTKFANQDIGGWPTCMMIRWAAPPAVAIIQCQLRDQMGTDALLGLCWDFSAMSHLRFCRATLVAR